MIAPSSNPKRIYERLLEDCRNEEGHSDRIRGYKKTFTRLARGWLSDGSITKEQHDEILASVRSPSWKIWRPVLYVIPRAPIEAGKRLKLVRVPDRAAFGPEMTIEDLHVSEYDVIELDPL